MKSLRKNVITKQFRYLVEYMDGNNKAIQIIETKRAESYEAGLLLLKSKYEQAGINATVFEI